MADRLSRLDFGLINKLLLIGCLLVACELFVLAFSYDGEWEEKRALGLRKNAFAQKVLFEALIRGASQGEVLKMVRKEAAKPENKKQKLKVGDKRIVFGEISILFENGKASDVE